MPRNQKKKEKAAIKERERETETETETQVLGALPGSCHPLFVALVLSYSVHARIGRRDLRDGAANDQTHLLAGGDVRHGTLEQLGLAEPADEGTARMAAGLRQPQQQWLNADPRPYGQPRALQRRSPLRGGSGWAGYCSEEVDWQGAWCSSAMLGTHGGSKLGHCSTLRLRGCWREEF